MTKASSDRPAGDGDGKLNVWQQIADLAKSLQQRTSAGHPPTPQELQKMNRLIEQAKNFQEAPANDNDE